MRSSSTSSPRGLLPSADRTQGADHGGERPHAPTPTAAKGDGQRPDEGSSRRSGEAIATREKRQAAALRGGEQGTSDLSAESRRLESDAASYGRSGLTKRRLAPGLSPRLESPSVSSHEFADAVRRASIPAAESRKKAKIKNAFGEGSDSDELKTASVTVGKRNPRESNLHKIMESGMAARGAENAAPQTPKPSSSELSQERTIQSRSFLVEAQRALMQKRASTSLALFNEDRANQKYAAVRKRYDSLADSLHLPLNARPLTASNLYTNSETFAAPGFWKENDPHVRARARERLKGGTPSEEEVAKFAEDSTRASDRPASGESPMHINTATILDPPALDARHHEGDETKYSSSEKMFRVKAGDGQMRTANDMLTVEAGREWRLKGYLT